MPAAVNRLFPDSVTVTRVAHLAQDQRQELRVGDVLQLRDDDPPRLLEEDLVQPVGVDAQQLPRHAVVLPHPQRVQSGQPRVLVHPHVTGLETPVEDSEASRGFTSLLKRGCSIQVHPLFYRYNVSRVVEN